MTDINLQEMMKALVTDNDAYIRPEVYLTETELRKEVISELRACSGFLIREMEAEYSVARLQTQTMTAGIIQDICEVQEVILDNVSIELANIIWATFKANHGLATGRGNDD